MERTDRPGMNPEKKMLLIFLLIAFGLPLLLRIPQGFLQAAGVDTNGFANAHMHYPAAGFILAMLICQRENKLLPRRFFYGFLLITVVMALWNLALFFLPAETVSGGNSFLLAGGSIVLGLLLFMEGGEKRRACGIKGGDARLSVLLILLFVVLLLLRTVLPALLSGAEVSLGGISPFKLIALIPQLLILFPFVFLGFFGEEYGWRVYFQPFLQRKFGLIVGVLLFGLLWELWHVPLAGLYPFVGVPAEETILQLCFRLTNTLGLGVFFAFGYMKTGSLWVPVVFHFLNNNLGPLLLQFTPESGAETSCLRVGLGMLFNLALFLPFLFSKVFRTSPAAAVAVEVAEAIEAPPEMEDAE